MDENMTKAYKLRTPTLDDLFPMVEIIKKIGFEEIEKCFSRENTEKIIANINDEGGKADVSAVGYQIGTKIFGVIVRNLGVCKDDIYQLLSQLSGLTISEVGALPLPTVWKMLKELINGDTFKDFFTEASELAK